MAKVTVIAALFNHEKYLSQAIESVINQTYKDWELIIWDDGSTDQSLEIAKKFQKMDSRIKVFTHENKMNLGQEKTRNLAIDKSSGEFLSLLDTDDYFLPSKLERLVDRMKDPTVGLVYGRTDFYDEKTQKIIKSGIQNNPSGNVLSDLIYDNFICACSVLIRKNIINEGIQFDSNYKTCGEYPLWVEIAKKWKVSFVDEVIAVWRKHNENTGTKYELLAKEELVLLKKKWIEDKSLGEIKGEIYKSYYKSVYDLAAMNYQKLNLEVCKKLCKEILLTTNSEKKYQMKAQIMYSLCLIGKLPNQMISKFKTFIWEMRK